MNEMIIVMGIFASILLMFFLSTFIRSIAMLAAMLSYFVFAWIQMIYGIDQTTAVINAINWSLPVWLYTWFAVQYSPKWPLIIAQGVWTSLSTYTESHKGEN